MTNRVTIVTSPEPDAGPLVEAWAKNGLLGDCLWVPLAELDRSGTPVSAYRVQPGEELLRVDLLRALAQASKLPWVHVVSVRRSREAEDRTAFLLQELVRQVVAADAAFTRVTQYDLVLVTPDDLPDALPQAPAGWVPFVMSPEDRPGPGRADAGVRPETLLPAGLHAAAGLAGVLGGTWEDVPGIHGSNLEDPVVVRCISRVVFGGSKADALLRDFLVDGLPSTEPSMLSSHHFLTVEGAEAGLVVEGALSWIRSAHDGVFRYRRPVPPAWVAPPRVGFLRLLRNYLGFSLWALGQVAVGTRRGWLSSASAAVDRAVTSVDLGHHVGDEAAAGSRAGVPWRQLDAQLSREAESIARQVATGASTESSPEAWRSLLEVTTCLVDGGGPPPGLDPVERHHRRATVRPSWVVEDLTAACRPPAALDLSVSGPVEAELDLLEPIRAAVLARSLRHLASLTEVEPSNDGIASHQVVATAVRLAETEAEQARARAEQEAEAARAAAQEAESASPKAVGPPGFLPRLRAAVVGDLLSAASDFAWWSGAAARSTELDEEALARLLKRFAQKARMLALVVVVVALAWWRWGEVLRLAVLDRWDWQLQTWHVATVIALTVIVLLVVWTTRLYRAYMRDAERARRLLEARLRALAAAAASGAERNRLRSVDRRLAQWCEILSRSLSPLSHREQPGGRSDVGGGGLPVALQAGEPELDETEVRQIVDHLRQRTARPGWRRDWVSWLALVAASRRDDLSIPAMTESSRAALHALEADDAVQREGPLRDLRRALDRGDPQAVLFDLLAREWVSLLTHEKFGVERLRVRAPRIDTDGTTIEDLEAWLRQLHVEGGDVLDSEIFTDGARHHGRHRAISTEQVGSSGWCDDAEERIRANRHVVAIRSRVDLVTPASSDLVFSPSVRGEDGLAAPDDPQSWA